MKEITEPQTRVHWSAPTATDDSGVKPYIHCNKQNGEINHRCQQQSLFRFTRTQAIRIHDQQVQ